jgi:hypothetical protein
MMVEQDDTRHRLSGCSQEATKEATSVIRLPTERLGEAVTLLAPCLVNNLNFVDNFQEARARSQALTHMFAADLGDFRREGFSELQAGSSSRPIHVPPLDRWRSQCLRVRSR